MDTWVQILIAGAAWASIVVTIVIASVRTVRSIDRRLSKLGERITTLEAGTPHDRRCKMVVVQGVRRMRRALKAHLSQDRLWKDQIEGDIQELKGESAN